MTALFKIKENKWLNAAVPALLLHSCIGSVYCWSLLKGEIAAEMGVSVSSVEFAFSLAIFFLGMSAAFGGRFVEKNVKTASRLSTMFFCVGLVGAVWAIRIGSVPALFAFYGVCMGIGLGLGYLSPVKTLMIWFSEHKGLATGIAIAGFGLSKVLFSPYIQWSNAHHGIEFTLLTMSGISLVLMGFSSLFLKKPSAWREDLPPFRLRDSLKIIFNFTYIRIWLIFYLNITCGLALIAYEKELAGTVAGIVNVGLVASLTAAFNTFGRLGYSTLSDAFPRNKAWVYCIIFASSAIACALPVAGWMKVIVVVLLCVVNAGYGGGFSTLPNLLSSKFGLRQISTIHGFALSAWAWAGLSGNQLANLIVNYLKLDFGWLMTVLAVLYVLSLGISVSLLSFKKENSDVLPVAS